MKRVLIVAFFNLVLGDNGFPDASDFGFSPEATGMKNVVARQKTLDLGGTIVVSQPGTYNIASTLYVGSNTEIIFGKGVSLKKKLTNKVVLRKSSLTKVHLQKLTTNTLQLKACILS